MHRPLPAAVPGSRRFRVFLDRVVNMVEEGMDVAVRIGPLPDSGLKALRVGRVRRMLCASPDYLARHGVPKHPSDLAGHAIIGTTNLLPRAGWRFGVTDEPTLVRMKPRLTVTSNDGAIAAASGGLGIARLLSYQVVTNWPAGSYRCCWPRVRRGGALAHSCAAPRKQVRLGQGQGLYRHAGARLARSAAGLRSFSASRNGARQCSLS